MSKVINSYKFGDMRAIYILDEKSQNIELLLLPDNMEYKEKVTDKTHPDNLIQIKLVGDTYNGAYAPGVTMRQSPSTIGFIYKQQEVFNGEFLGRKMTTVKTVCEDERGYTAIHYLKYVDKDLALRSYTEFINNSESQASIEMISSFSLGKISPYTEGDGHDSMMLHRIRSVWSMEGRLESIPFEDLQLEPSWSGHAVRCERFGNAGSLAVNKFFPTMAIEDKQNGLFWGASIAHNASWQMEVYRRGDDIQISGGLADRELGHFLKNVGPNMSFTTPEAIISVCKADDNFEIFSRLTNELDKFVEAGPESEQTLPVLFNEYCTTWGNPSHDNISSILKAIKGHGFEYFVIDCGWYKKEGIPWDVMMGDYDVSKELFSEGLDKTVELIKSYNLKPGIWFEIDNVGCRSEAYSKINMLLTRDGYPITTTMRRFFDLRKPETIQYLNDKVIGLLKKYGFEYMKIDCNDTVGIGCDGAESLGEGLRENQEASVNFIRSVKESIPGIILENCASGGHKLEALMMSECAMASFSDAHECEEIPIIAANLHRVILPRQSQIWAVIRESDSLKRIAYSVANTFLGRMCISGDVMRLSDEQWRVIDDGIEFYKAVADIIKHGKTRVITEGINSYRNPSGYQVVVREGHNEARGKLLVVIHGFKNATGCDVAVDIPKGYQLVNAYSYKDEGIAISDGKIRYTFDEDMKAIGIYLSRDDSSECRNAILP